MKVSFLHLTLSPIPLVTHHQILLPQIASYFLFYHIMTALTILNPYIQILPLYLHLHLHLHLYLHHHYPLVYLILHQILPLLSHIPYIILNLTLIPTASQIPILASLTILYQILTLHQLLQPQLSSLLPLNHVYQLLHLQLLLTSTHSMTTHAKSGIFKPKVCYMTQPNYSVIEPPSYKIASQYSNQCNAMQEEYDALQRQGTWSLVPPPTKTLLVVNGSTNSNTIVMVLF